MKVQPVIPRLLAGQDVEQALDYDMKEAGPEVALGFIDALEQAIPISAGSRPVVRRVMPMN